MRCSRGDPAASFTDGAKGDPASWQSLPLAEFDHGAAEQYFAIRDRRIESLAALVDDESELLAPEVEKALAMLVAKLLAPPKEDPHRVHVMRFELKRLVRAKLVRLEKRTEKMKKKKKKGGIDGLSKKVRFRLASVEFAKRLSLLLDPARLQKKLADMCADNGQSRATTAEDVVVDDGVDYSYLWAAAPAPPAGWVMEGEADYSEMISTRRYRESGVRPLSLPTFKHDIRALAADWSTRSRVGVPSGVPAGVAAAADELPERRVRKIRERYLTSILKSIVVQHTPGNTIDQDYPVPQRFHDALKAFPATKRESVTELGFEMDTMAAAEKNLVIFRPKPFIKLDGEDEGAEGLFALRPPVSTACLGSLGAAKTPAEVRSIVTEIRWALQSGERHFKPTKDDLLASIHNGLKDSSYRDPRSLEKPTDKWSTDSLGRLAVTRLLSPYFLGSSSKPPKEPPEERPCSVQDSRRSVLQDSKRSLFEKRRSTKVIEVVLTDEELFKAAVEKLRGNPTIDGCAGAVQSQPDESLAAKLKVGSRGAIAVDAAAAAQAAAEAAEAIEQRRSRSGSSRRSRFSRGSRSFKSLHENSTIAAPEAWASEPAPRPMSASLMDRVEACWDALDLDELDRLDFICKYVHRDFAPNADAVVALYERLPGPFVDCETFADNIIRNHNMGHETTADDVEALETSLGQLAEATMALFTEHGEHLFVRDASLASLVLTTRAEVLAAIAPDPV